MSEVTFAKTFLTTLDKRPIKLPADHVSDPRKYPNQSPYILPRQSHAFPKKSAADITVAQSSRSITVTIKPMRGGETTTLTNISLENSVHDIKAQYAQRISSPLEKIKLLLNKKPAADLKTLQELGIDGDVELSAMVMGGGTTEATSGSVTSGAEIHKTPMAATTAPTPKIDTSADEMEVDSQAAHPGSEKAQMQAEESVTGTTGAGPSGPGALHTVDFWQDLEGFLTQRLRDKAEAEKLNALFKHAWANQQ